MPARLQQQLQELRDHLAQQPPLSDDDRTALATLLDDEADYPAAAGLVRKLRFLDKFEQDIGDALEALLD